MPKPTPSNTTPLALEQVGKRFPGGVAALEAVSLQVRPGEFVALLGPSGCGKSTVLRLVAGLEAPSTGQVRTPAHTHPGQTAFVFQDPTLMPWASVFDNVWLPLRLRGLSRHAAAPRVTPVLARVGLAAFARALPAELSGGMRMRVSMARALVTNPHLLLMDEPFAALDEITRHQLNADLLAWQRTAAITTLFVTHSVSEAVFLSERVLVMSARPGRVTATFAIEAPAPRDAAWCTSAAYAAQCRVVSQALAAACGLPSAPEATP